MLKYSWYASDFVLNLDPQQRGNGRLASRLITPSRCIYVVLLSAFFHLHQISISLFVFGAIVCNLLFSGKRPPKISKTSKDFQETAKNVHILSSGPPKLGLINLPVSNGI